jgi:hypothetical protein
LGDGEKWPERGSISYNTILQLDRVCEREGKWTKVPYIQLFFFPRDHREWVSKCRLDTQTIVTLGKNPPNSLEEPEPKKPSDAQGPPIMSKRASPMTEMKCPEEPQRIYPTLRLGDAPSAPPPPHCPATLHP